MENFIKKISAFLAVAVVFLLAGSMYLSMKGFVYDEDNGFILTKAYATEGMEARRTIASNYAFPQDHVWGKNDAKVTLYEYSSFGCSHCADMHIEVIPQVVKKYVDNGSVRIVFVPLPLDKNSMDAALLAECVAPGRYFDFAQVLFKKQMDWMRALDPRKVLRQYAMLNGVSNEKAEACLRDDKTAARILGDRKAGLTDLGIQGTPSFVVSSKYKNEILSGYQSFEDLSAVIDQHLSAVYNSAVE